MRIGILGCAEIAFRRFLPALQKCDTFEFVGVASRTPEKAIPFQEVFGGQIYDSYEALLQDSSIGAVYIPLPPALHFEWGKKALLAGKHVLMEKPFTVSAEQTKSLLVLAKEKNLAVHENYMFLYHSQLTWIKEQVREGAIGQLRLIRATFGFPFRGKQDFRYEKHLGGGALLDCGGYPVRLASNLLGEETRVVSSHLCNENLDVDLYGSVTLENSNGLTAQISFGMDNSYRCELEIWGSTGQLIANRIFTAPPGFSPTISMQTKDGEKIVQLDPDDAFLNSLKVFGTAITDNDVRKLHFLDIQKQSDLINAIQIY